jgi:NADH:ubiquinone oxidoreductase subunit 2 (subunit N)
MFVPLLFVLTLFSLVGIFPLTGFCTKVSILIELIYYELYGVAAIAAFSSFLNGYYYFILIKFVYFEEANLDLSVPNLNRMSF